jgi:Bacterial Ig-like domain (group 3)/Domain of unknown function (DUF4214)
MAQFGQIRRRGRAVPLILATGAGLVLAQLAHSTIGASALTGSTTTVKVPATAVVNSPVALTAAVSPVPANPAGNRTVGVMFYDGPNAISPLRFSGTGRFSYSTQTLAIGSHSITAHFTGSSTEAPSVSAPATINIVQSGANAATMSFTSSPASPIQGGTAITFYVTMTGKPGVANPTGSVTFKNGATTMSAGRSLFNGAVSLPWPNGLPLGTNAISAIYSGDANYAAQTGTLSIVVTASPNDKFIQHVYTDMIGAQDPSGEAYWVSVLNRGVSRTQVAYAFTQTQAYANIVTAQLYQNIMQRPATADPAGANYWAGQLLHGVTPEEVAAAMVASPERFASPNFGNNDIDTFIAATYRALLGRAPDAPGAAYWHNFLAGGGARWQLTLLFVHSPEWAAVTVRNMYAKFHLGTPDPGGASYWAGQVMQGMSDDQLASQFLGSQPYWNFAQAN